MLAGQPAGALFPNATEKQFNITALRHWAVGDLNVTFEAGDSIGLVGRDFPSLLRL